MAGLPLSPIAGSAGSAGIELADSVTLDPHKWLYQPYECGCLLVREGERLRGAFEVTPDYLKDAAARAGEVNFSDLGFQLTRSSRALKLWLSLGYFGVDAFRDAIDRSLDLARAAERMVRRRAGARADVARPTRNRLLQTAFADTPEEWQRARLNAALVGQFEQAGLGLVSSTSLGGRYAIRLCVLNHTTREDDIARTIAWFAGAPVPSLRDPSAALALSVTDREPTVADSWGSGAAFDIDEVGALALFADLPREQLALVAASSTELRVPAGQTVVERWEGGRDFYVIVEGDAEVSLEQPVRHLSKGDFFGEVAALDWGSGFGYVRTATVVATSDLRLLILSPSRLAVLIRACPPLGGRLRKVATERMQKT